MKRIAYLCLALAVLLSLAAPALALDGQVVYLENAKEFIFLPGTDYSPTDLFPNFKDVMPGDSLEQPILLKNDISNKCKVKVYMRALGAHPDSVDFLSQLHLTVRKDTDTVMFDAAADQTAQLTEWTYLGTLYSGGECQLTCILEVPVTLDNKYRELIGYLDWEFAVEELPVEGTDPQPPQTGDTAKPWMWILLMLLTAAAVTWALSKKKAAQV